MNRLSAVNRLGRVPAVARTAVSHLASAFCLAVVGLSGCVTPVEDPAGVDDQAAQVAASTTGELRDTAVEVAEQTAVTLIALSHSDPEAGYDRLLAALTGPARQEWEQRRAEYLAPIVADSLTAQGAAVEASGVAAFDPAAPSATVLVAATAMIATAQDPDAEQRGYRLRMSLIRDGTGWKVSELQFVP